jgi:hypothetical protein
VSAIFEVLGRCKAGPPHESASAGHRPRSDIAHSAALTRAAPWSSSVMSSSMLAMGPSSLSSDPARSSIASSSGASSSIMADV